jgi:hypothetical protein
MAYVSYSSGLQSGACGTSDPQRRRLLSSRWGRWSRSAGRDGASLGLVGDAVDDVVAVVAE